MPRVKIRGLTSIQDAIRCIDLGADASEWVFYPKSTGHLTKDQTREICSAVPEYVKTVDVIADDTF